MKRLFLSLFCIPALLLTFCNDKVNSKEETESPASSTPDQLEKVTYQPSEEIICNPERGFFTHQEYATDNNHSITPAFLKECREKGMSLIFTAYYMRDFKDKLISEEYLQRIRNNMLALRKSGLVLDINPDLYGSATHSDLQGDPDYAGMLFPDRGAYEYVVTKTDTAYRLVKVDTAFIRVPYLVQKKKGMSLVEEAREAAGRLLELREGRHMILTGETNVFPQDGAALEEINRLEREYMALFAGKSFTETRHFRIWITPDQQMAGQKTTIFTFSETSGVNTSPDGPGEPVLMEIGPSGKTRDLNMVMRPASMQKHANPADRVYYRVPDVAEINISLAGENLCTARRLIYQYGSLVALPANFIIGK